MLPWSFVEVRGVLKKFIELRMSEQALTVMVVRTTHHGGLLGVRQYDDVGPAVSAGPVTPPMYSQAP